MKRIPDRMPFWVPGAVAAWALLVLIVALLAGCAPRVVTQDRPVAVSVPVPQPCAAPRPKEPVPLKTEVPDAEWRGLDLRQRAARVGRKGLEWLGYGQQLNAATAACPEAPAGESE